MTYKKDRTNYVVNNNKLNYYIHLKIFKHNLFEWLKIIHNLNV